MTTMKNMKWNLCGELLRPHAELQVAQNPTHKSLEMLLNSKCGAKTVATVQFEHATLLQTAMVAIDITIC